MAAQPMGFPGPQSGNVNNGSITAAVRGPQSGEANNGHTTDAVLGSHNWAGERQVHNRRRLGVLSEQWLLEQGCHLRVRPSAAL